MQETITLILSNSVDEGKKIVNQLNLIEDNCAIITHPEYVDDIQLDFDETIYADVDTLSSLIKAVQNKIKMLPKKSTVNIKFITV